MVESTGSRIPNRPNDESHLSTLKISHTLYVDSNNLKNKNCFFCRYLKYLTSDERYPLQIKTNLKEAKMYGAVMTNAIWQTLLTKMAVTVNS